MKSKNHKTLKSVNLKIKIMKTMQTSLLRLGVIVVIFSMITFVSCDTSDEGIETSEPVSSVDMTESDEVDMAVAGLMSLLEPVMIVVLGGSVGGIVIAMYLPIFSLIKHI